MVQRCLTAGTYVRGIICVSLQQCQVVTHRNWLLLEMCNLHNNYAAAYNRVTSSSSGRISHVVPSEGKKAPYLPV